MRQIDKRTFELDEHDIFPSRVISFKMSIYELEKLDGIVKALGFDGRSEFIRKAIRFAIRHLEQFIEEEVKPYKKNKNKLW
mgnify:CR=1 FL=1